MTPISIYYFLPTSHLAIKTTSNFPSNTGLLFQLLKHFRSYSRRKPVEKERCAKSPISLGKLASLACLHPTGLGKYRHRYLIRTGLRGIRPAQRLREHATAPCNYVVSGAADLFQRKWRSLFQSWKSCSSRKVNFGGSRRRRFLRQAALPNPLPHEDGSAGENKSSERGPTPVGESA